MDRECMGLRTRISASSAGPFGKPAGGSVQDGEVRSVVVFDRLFQPRSVVVFDRLLHRYRTVSGRPSWLSQADVLVLVTVSLGFAKLFYTGRHRVENIGES